MRPCFGIALLFALAFAGCGSDDTPTPDADPSVEASSPRREWVDGPRGRIRVDDGGEGGPPLVFIHGNGSNRSNWNAQLEHFRRSRRAVALDLPGMGDSEPPADGDYSVAAMTADVAHTIDALGIDRFVLVGHSWGGSVVATYAGQRPERLAGLVFADVSGETWDPPPEKREELERAFQPDSYEEVTQRSFERILVNATDATRETVMGTLRATPRDVFVGAIEGLLGYDLVAAQAAYDGPRLSIGAELLDGPRAMHSKIEGMPYHVMSDVSHWLMMDRPEEFNRYLEEFLAELE